MTAEGKRSQNRIEYTILIGLATLLFLSWIAVSLQFLRPERSRAGMDAVVQDCLGIISSAQRWYRSSSVVGGANRQSWHDLSFTRIGYEEGVQPDGRTLINNNARYTLRVPDHGSSFDLIAEGSGGAMVVYRGITDNPPPDPEIR